MMNDFNTPDLQRLQETIEQIGEAASAALQEMHAAFMRVGEAMAEVFSVWRASLPPEVKAQFIQDQARAEKKERHRRRYQRMMERGRSKRR